MSSQKYESGKLNSILQTLFKKNASGILNLKTQVSGWQEQRSCVLLLHHGSLVYGEPSIAQVPSNKEVCQKLGKKLKPNLINAALSVAIERITEPASVRELMELLTKMRVFSWQEVEATVVERVVLILEQFLPYPGEAKWQPNVEFDLTYGEDKHGLSFSDIKQKIKHRQQKWQQYAPTIPNLGAIPIVTPEQLRQIGDREVKKHLANSANGQNTLLDIADKMGKDPLKIAKSYLNWANNNWVNIETTTVKTAATVSQTKNKIKAIQNTVHKNAMAVADPPVVSDATNPDLPTVLSVDDSPIIQISIKRALQQEYNVLLANNAADALTMLDQHPIKLMLLDLTMPDVDGLEFCRAVRQIPKFQDLPIVMVTARDGLVNKMKGHIAGTSKYLTKPFLPEQLREVVSEYINS